MTLQLQVREQSGIPASPFFQEKPKGTMFAKHKNLGSSDYIRRPMSPKYKNLKTLNSTRRL
jgi:hypothetical protein